MGVVHDNNNEEEEGQGVATVFWGKFLEVILNVIGNSFNNCCIINTKERSINNVLT